MIDTPQPQGTPETTSKRLAVSDDRPVWVWGLPLMPWTMAQTLDAIDAAIAVREPSYFITANLYYAMLTSKYKDLPYINRGAAFVLADGMPLVWASRYRERRLPERVAGSDLIFRISERAAQRGYRLFFLGGGPGVGEEAARRLRERYPGVSIVGIEAPDMGGMSSEEAEALHARIRAARPDLLMAALGQPKGERWIVQHCEGLGVPLCVQVGATLDFAAGRVRRAPRWMQKTGLEWVFRFMLEPRRLGPRYFQSILFLMKMVARDLVAGGTRERGPSVEG